ncbi:LGFP repeat-containing protein [Corynebacterium timonense]|uniref:LGFP repeat-containing protein n=1 Tax=Corynebacterium timonense TaxID=441500 RepID=A0A1H1QMM4_9CORY|nr:hypothetical protein [Corynebacterium timonense]SDS24626.1 LGFP repeat-containing protein [Corynebacterium timonense]
MIVRKKIAASAAALALVTGLTACADEEQPEETTAQETAAEESEEQPSEEVTPEPEEQQEQANESTDTPEGVTVEVTTADGATVLVPQGVAEAMSQYAEADWGEPVEVEEVDNGWIVSYDDEHYIAWNENTGGAPTWGEIANNWLTNVRADSSLGFPVAPEEVHPDQEGWVQEFENGRIEWVRGADGVFTANVIEE